jgi:hypothetical protein
VTLHGASLDRLARMDARLRHAHGRLRSLCPTRAEATPLVAIGERALTACVSPEVGAAFAEALARVAEAQSRNFPENVFWDLDYPASRLLSFLATGTSAASEGARRLEGAVELVESLEAGYGCRSPLRFRYVHDFVYGFDWARWVRREPSARARVGPFERPFLEYLLCRASEIEALIQQDDAKYHQLAEGVSRNPFGFSREPAEEERLHRALAEAGWIPVEAWREDAEPQWDRPYAELREQRAAELGLARKP